MARTDALLIALVLAAGCHHAPPAEPPPAPEAPPSPADHDALTKIALLEATIVSELGAIAQADSEHKVEALAAIEPHVTELVTAADALADRTTAPACEAGVAAAAHALARDFHGLLVDDPDDRTSRAARLQRSTDDLAARLQACLGSR